MFYTYIIRSINHPDQRYIGSTSDLRKRLAKHNAGEVPHTSKFKPWKVEAYFAFETKEKAAAFEAISKPVPDTHSPTVTSENCNPTRSQIPLIRQSEFAKLYTTHFLFLRTSVLTQKKQLPLLFPAF